MVVEYPSADTPAVAGVVYEPPLNSPEKEWELTSTTIARALGMDGWYVLCSAGIDSKYYEEIAAYIETQEKMFAYTELATMWELKNVYTLDEALKLYALYCMELDVERCRADDAQAERDRRR